MKDDQGRLLWQRADSCESSGCVEVAVTGEGVMVRNSRDPDGPKLHFTRKEWEEFAAGVREGQFSVE